jgi:hypothetical protein
MGAEPRSRPLPVLPGIDARVIVAFLVGALLAAGITWLVVHPRPTDEVSVDVLTGSIYTSGDRDAMEMRVTSGHPAGGYGYNPRTRSFGTTLVPDGVECLRPTTDTPARIGVVFTKPTADGPGLAVVAWVRCLGGA